jgi:hypothetical protein
MSDRIVDERLYLKVKVKSLAAEAKIIRKEEKRCKNSSLRNGLYRHRIDVVRYEARHTNLAYGFLRGRTYSQIESGAKKPPDWAKVRKMVEKYGAPVITWTNWAEYEQRKKESKQHLAETLKRFDVWAQMTPTA